MVQRRWPFRGCENEGTSNVGANKNQVLNNTEQQQISFATVFKTEVLKFFSKLNQLKSNYMYEKERMRKKSWESVQT